MAINKAHPKSRIYDAYFSNELGVENDATNVMEPERIGLHKNLFTNFAVTGALVSEWGQSGGRYLENMADPENNPSLKLKPDLVKNPIEVKRLKHPFPFFFSKPTIKYGESVKGGNWDSSKAINITMLFAVGTELNRLGIRSFFPDDGSLNGIIIIPGVEPGFFGIPNSLEKSKGRWGISIRDEEIRILLKDFFGVKNDVAFKVVILAAYSTGTNGINQTILNDLINLSNVKRIVFFDCLFLTSSGSTIDTLKKMKKLNANIQIIIYWSSVSTESNSVDKDVTKLLVVEQAKPTVTMSGNVISLLGKEHYHCLIVSRMIEIGITEKFLKLSTNAMKAFTDYKAIVPPRGKVMSDKKMFTSIHKSIPAGAVELDEWYNKNKKVVDNLYKNFITKSDGTNPALLTQVHKNQLLGWQSSGAETHDLLIPDFGWEYLRLSH